MKIMIRILCQRIALDEQLFSGASEKNGELLPEPDSEYFEASL
jgi:hypothetical protein